MMLLRHDSHTHDLPVHTAGPHPPAGRPYFLGKGVADPGHRGSLSAMGVLR